MAREVKKIRATAKKLRFHFFRKHAPQSERFRFVFYIGRLWTCTCKGDMRCRKQAGSDKNSCHICYTPVRLYKSEAGSFPLISNSIMATFSLWRGSWTEWK
ncbi:DUF1661 domain-containing protein [Porphyromonas gulae]|uniref:DUF1661 domain-containing protein n=1 Tax=Porphyromonas gulae TaxID=111105 RepID=UPI0018B03057|nr:DUF1661 domain-containing protein [Porphyromonas gulae]